MPTLEHVRDRIIGQTYREVLPGKFASPEASVMLLAIGLQESRFTHREQIGGPAHGFWQFERRGGVAGVLTHEASKAHALAACAIRGVVPSSTEVYRRIVDDDLLACSIARLLLWTDPEALPKVGHADAAWDLYLRTWRPGKPHRSTWNGLYSQAVAIL